MFIQAGSTRLAIGVLALVMITLITAPASAGDPVPGAAVAVWGRVFLDTNGDGVFEPETESGVPDVTVSNGETAFLTGPDGSFSTIVDRTLSQFVWMTRPKGRGSTTAFYDRVDPVALNDTMYFGLRDDPASGSGPFTFAQITDSHILAPLDGQDVATDFADISATFPPPSFVVATGDLVENGSMRNEFGYYRQAMASLTVPIWNGYGNHDADPNSPSVLAAYQDSLGPTYYSFDYSDVHFVMLNSMDRPPAQDGWLTSDLSLIAPGTRVILCRHDPPTRTEMDDYVSRGIDAVTCGHWHGDRVLQYKGLQIFNTPPIRMPGFDRSPRGFRLVHVGPDSIGTEMRWGGLSQHLAVVSPADSTPHVPGMIPVWVDAYDSSVPVTAVTASMTGPDGQLPPMSLTRQSEWSWGASWDATKLGEGAYDMVVTVDDAAGRTWSTMKHFSLIYGLRAPVVATSEWRFFHGGVDHSGRASDSLSLPLALAWAVPAGGTTGLSSPVVSSARVFIGTGRNGDPAEAGVSAFDAASGTQLWRQTTSSSVRNTVAVTETGVFATTINGVLHCFDPMTGDLRWRVAMGDTAIRWETSSPTVLDDLVFAGRAMQFGVRVAGTGSLQHEFHLGQDWVPNDYPSAAITTDRIYLSSSYGLFAIDRASGTLAWSVPALSLGLAVDVEDCVVYTVDGLANGEVYLTARDWSNGAQIWRSTVQLGYALSSPALSDSLVVVGSGHEEIYAFDRATGSLRWTFHAGPAITSTRPYVRVIDDVVSSPAISGSNVFIGAGDGYLYGLDLATGNVSWRFKLGAPIRSSPAVSGNTLFVTADDGTLYAFAPQVIIPPSGGTEETPIVTQPGLELALPSPLRAGDHIYFHGPAGGAASGDLALVDVRGRIVRRLFTGDLGTTRRDLVWDGHDSGGSSLAPGIYFAALTTTHGSVKKKILVVR